MLDAAIAVLARGGARALTHRAVDRTAGLPAGSTSNLFRTRAALVVGVLERIAEAERAALGAVGEPSAEIDEPAVVAVCASAIADALGPGRERSLARRTLFQEAALDSAVAPVLLEATRPWWQLAGELLSAAGVPDAPRRGRLLLAYLDGVIADQLARPEPEFDPVEAIRPAVRGIFAA